MTPAPVRAAVALLLTAIGLGVAEALVHLALPDPPSAGQLATRFAVYAALAALVLALRTGRPAVRWAVLVLLGGVGTLSLVAEPVTWLLAGGSPVAFAATADGATWLVTALRVAHLAAVAGAVGALLHPAARGFFRTRGAPVGRR